MFEHFLSAFALVLVFEGMLPFLNPEKWRQTMRKMMHLEDQKLRVIGFISMLVGVGILYLVHA